MTANSNYPEIDRERLLVIDNIERALRDGDSFRKVEMNDPQMSEEQRAKIILPFDNLRKNPINKLKAAVAQRLASKEVKKRKNDTRVLGLENLYEVKGGAIITSNHFNPIDTTLIRHMLRVWRGTEELYTVIEETNVLMRGLFGFLMKNCNTLPVSASPRYMAKNLKPAINELMKRGKAVLIYPEEQMWYNYKKPREHRDGAYYYASEFSVPILPCFTEMKEGNGFDALGFKNLQYVLHIMPPIYPKSELSTRENVVMMRECDKRAKREAYKSAYGEYPTEEFCVSEDIGGYWI